MKILGVENGSTKYCLLARQQIFRHVASVAEVGTGLAAPHGDSVVCASAEHVGVQIRAEESEQRGEPSSVSPEKQGPTARIL